MKLALLTSNQKRHQYVAHVLAANHDLQLVIAEKKANQSQMIGKTLEETKILNEHFSRLQQVNDEFFTKICHQSIDVISLTLT